MISIIVPVKNGLAYTRALMASVRARNPRAAIEWIVVDSGSTDGTPAFCSEGGARVVPLRREPFNYCAALNAGADAAAGELWIVANNDVEFQTDGDLARLERIFREWPVVSVVSPGRPAGGVELEFRRDWLYGPCWAVRPEEFRAWGGMPETLSGYGYDELWTVFQSWRRGRALACLTGWEVFHHGSVSFGPAGGNVTPALRRNLSRLLALFDAPDLDQCADPLPVIERLVRRELGRCPLVLEVAGAEESWLRPQGYAGARDGPRDGSSGRARVHGDRRTADLRQWLPWLANELLLQPEAAVVGAEGWYAARTSAGPSEAASGNAASGKADSAAVMPLVAEAQAVGPPAPALMAPLAERRLSLRERLAVLRNDWRHRRSKLPAEW